MTFAINGRLSIKINANVRATFGSAIHELIETIAAQRSTAKFLFACGILLITILVMLSRAP